MQMRARRYELTEPMTLKREISGTIERRDAKNVRNPCLRSAVLRTRIKRIVGIVLIALVYSIYRFYRSAYLRKVGDWSSFWVGEAFVGVYLVVAVTLVLRKKPKL